LGKDITMAGKIANGAIKAIIVRTEGMRVRMISLGLTSGWQQAGLRRSSVKEHAFHELPPNEIIFANLSTFLVGCKNFIHL
jgi:hypothetical protein